MKRMGLRARARIGAAVEALEDSMLAGDGNDSARKGDPVDVLSEIEGEI